MAKVLEHVDELFGDSADIVVYEPLEGDEAKQGSLAKHAGAEQVGHASHRGPMRDDVSMALPVRLDHCVIHVSDWDVSNAFYRDVVGAELVETGGRLAYRFGAQQLNLHGPGVSPAQVARLPVQPGNSDLCFAWDGPIEDAVAHLDACGVAVELGPVERSGARGTGRSVYFRDPDGSLLEFIAYA